ncbi:MAG: peptidyl-prolyl cis-trans isomerase [Acidobacteriota bacterium]
MLRFDEFRNEAMFQVMYRLFAIVMVLVWNEGCGFYGEKEEEKNVIAIIGGREITVEMLEKYFYDNLNGILSVASIKDFEQDETDVDKVKSRLFEDFIDTQLLLGEAIKAGVTVGGEEVNEFLKGFGGEEEKAGKLRKGEMERLTEFLMIQKFKSEKLFPGVTVSDTELKQYVQEKMEELKKTHTVTLSIIIVETENEARELFKKIRGNQENFNSLAEKYAVPAGQSGPQVYNIDELPENIRDEVKRLKVGQISKPMSLLGRSCIFRLESVEAEGMKSFEEIAQSMKERLLREKCHAMLEDHLKKLKTGGEIKIFYERLPFHFIRENS